MFELNYKDVLIPIFLGAIFALVFIAVLLLTEDKNEPKTANAELEANVNLEDGRPTY